MPKVMISWETMTSLERARRYGSTHRRSMVSHSWGGPGSISTWTPSAAKAQPGAVPTGLSNTVQPSGSSACWVLFSGMGTWRADW